MVQYYYFMVCDLIIAWARVPFNTFESVASPVASQTYTHLSHFFSISIDLLPSI